MHIFTEEVGILLKLIFIHDLIQTLFLFGCLCVVMPQIFSLVTFEKKEKEKTLYRLSKVMYTSYDLLKFRPILYYSKLVYICFRGPSWPSLFKVIHLNHGGFVKTLIYFHKSLKNYLNLPEVDF